MQRTMGPRWALPSNLKEWTDNHALRALLVHGHDGVGNLLVGPTSRVHSASQQILRLG